MIKALVPFFTYFLAVQKCHHNSDYTIHGLWIDYQRGGYPEFCKPAHFDVNELKTLKPTLDLYWPSCFGKNEGLWEHEWKKHGTCFNLNNGTMIKYFNSTLNLFLTHKEELRKCNQQNCLIPIEYYKI
jgi:ribonuclease I